PQAARGADQGHPVPPARPARRPRQRGRLPRLRRSLLHHRADRQRQRRPHHELTRTPAMDTTLPPEHIGLYTGKGFWPNRLITDYLDEAAAAAPDKVAAIDPRGRTTYGELKRLADRAALGLLELGIGPGDVVSYQLPNWTEFLILHYAATRI